MTRRLTMAENLAIELRWLDHRDHTKPGGRIASMTRDEVWARCSRLLQDIYRADARHLLAVIEPYRRAASRL